MDYLKKISKEIDDNFKYIETWRSEIEELNNNDPTFINTCNNFFIVWLNSINEFLFEKIIYLYYEEFLSTFLIWNSFSDNQFQYELSKINKFILNNHHWSYDAFLKILENIIWNIELKNIKDLIKKDIGSWFFDRLWKINSSRNSIWHNSERFFNWTRVLSIWFNEFDDYILEIKTWMHQLSKNFYNEMNNFYRINII